MNEPQKIVIIGANGGIGQAAAAAIARTINEAGTNYEVALVTRTKEGRKGNPGLGVASEILESSANDRNQHPNADLERAFRPELHTQFNGDRESLKDTLKGASVVMITAGAPRTSPTQQRSDLIAKNVEAIVPYVEAVAKYAPGTPIIICPNPIDNLVEIAEKALQTINPEPSTRTETKKLKVIGMAGSLDESRLQIFTARALNAALKESGSDEYIHPRDVRGNVYGQHGPTMVIDLNSITIARGDETQSLHAFITTHGLEDKRDAINEAIQKNTRGAGGKILADLGRSAQTSPAERMWEMALALLTRSPDNPLHVRASVLHSVDGEEGRAVASGCPVSISSEGISRMPYPDRVIHSGVGRDILDSRREIRNDQVAYDLLTVVRSASAITHDGNQAQLEFRDVSQSDVKRAQEILKEALGLEDNSIKTKSRVAPASITLAIDENQYNTLKTAVSAAGKEIMPPTQGHKM